MKTLLFTFALLVEAAALPGRAQPPPVKPAATPAVSLAFLPLPGLVLVEKDTYQYEAGIVDTVRTPRWERVFTLKNMSRRPITLSRLRGSCGCETLLLLQGGVPVPAARLAPGERAAIHLAVSLHPGQPGVARKYVWVDGPRTASGQAVTLATLEVDLRLRQSVSFAPAFLDFGRVEAGAGARRAVTATFDPDLLPDSSVLPGASLLSGASAPMLDGAGPDVRALPLGPMQRITEEGQPRLRQTYQVLLSPSAHAGRVWGALRLGLPPLPGGGPALVAGFAVSGMVAGALDARPATVFFGSLRAGAPATRSVVLSLVPPGRQSLTVTSSSPWLVAALDRPGASGPHRLLSVTLTRLAPPGPIQGKVTVALSSGERLDIPVIAELTH